MPFPDDDPQHQVKTTRDQKAEYRGNGKRLQHRRDLMPVDTLRKIARLAQRVGSRDADQRSITQCELLFGIANAHVSTFHSSADAKMDTSMGTAGDPSGGVKTSGGRIPTSA